MMENYWYNYVTKEYEYADAPMTDDEAAKYIPQIQAAQSLYKIHRKMGLGILESMKEVLEAVVGQNK